MTDPSTRPLRLALIRRWLSMPPQPPSLVRVAGWALAVRVGAADLVQWFTQRKGVLCVFPDSSYYWLLAAKIRRGEPYELLDFGDLPHFALRTPGYPLFLAACQWLFGPRVMPVRLVQSALGAGCVWLIAWLVRRALPAEEVREAGAGTGWSVPLIAAVLVAFEPYTVVNSAFLLSEALFVPLLLLTQWGLAVLWSRPGEQPRRFGFLAFLNGAAWGATVLVRPSWWLYVPVALVAWVAFAGRGSRRSALKGAVLVLLGVCVVMGPWWVRNARIYGKFVPTSLWMGASLYDGLNPRATGASDMRFLADPEFWPLGEEEQDALLSRRAVEFAKENPARVLMLVAVKAARFWSPWPNAETFYSLPLAVASALVTLPIFALMGLGLWDRRRDPRALVLLALPLAYTFALHLVFVSSMRYRVPAEVPALGLAAIGLRRVVSWWKG